LHVALLRAVAGCRHCLPGHECCRPAAGRTSRLRHIPGRGVWHCADRTCGCQCARAGVPGRIPEPTRSQLMPPVGVSPSFPGEPLSLVPVAVRPRFPLAALVACVPVGRAVAPVEAAVSQGCLVFHGSVWCCYRCRMNRYWRRQTTRHLRGWPLRKVPAGCQLSACNRAGCPVLVVIGQAHGVATGILVVVGIDVVHDGAQVAVAVADGGICSDLPGVGIAGAAATG